MTTLNNTSSRFFIRLAIATLLFGGTITTGFANHPDQAADAVASNEASPLEPAKKPIAPRRHAIMAESNPTEGLYGVSYEFNITNWVAVRAGALVSTDGTMRATHLGLTADYAMTGGLRFAVPFSSGIEPEATVGMIMTMKERAIDCYTVGAGVRFNQLHDQVSFGIGITYMDWQQHRAMLVPQASAVLRF